MKSIGYYISAFLLAVTVSCNAPESASDVNSEGEITEQDREGMNTTKEDNTDVQTMEEKYKDSDEDLVKDSL